MTETFSFPARPNGGCYNLEVSADFLLITVCISQLRNASGGVGQGLVLSGLVSSTA